MKVVLWKCNFRTSVYFVQNFFPFLLFIYLLTTTKKLLDGGGWDWRSSGKNNRNLLAFNLKFSMLFKARFVYTKWRTLLRDFCTLWQITKPFFSLFKNWNFNISPKNWRQRKRKMKTKEELLFATINDVKLNLFYSFLFHQALNTFFNCLSMQSQFAYTVQYAK